ncbi:MAG: aldo/keto reductase [Gemmatimonadetes bacterium]|nr:aldo/keto reductase [Gemmatimonadota bacterium]
MWGSDLPDIIHGCWQLSEGHGAAWTDAEAFRALEQACGRVAIPVLDMADIYTGVEERIGRWLAARGSGDRRPRIHTKFVPDLARLPQVDRRWVEASVEGSLRRLGVERVDLVQFHWWDFSVPGWIETAGYVADLVTAGKVGAVGVTNFDRKRLEALLEAGVPVVSNQVQLSVLDRRALGGLADFCGERGVGLLCYGTLAGGLLHERWLERARPEDGNRSVAKYLQVVDEVGRWESLQAVLRALRDVAERCGLSVAEAAMSYARFQPAVRAIIVGLSRSPDRPPPRLRPLSEGTLRALAEVLPPTVPGEVYQAERALQGPHGRLMRYDLGGDPR